MSHLNERSEFYTTGEIAKLCGVSVRTVQYYDDRGILIPSELSEGGRRLYTEDDLKRIATVMMKLEHCSASKNLAATLRKKELIYRLLGMICGDAALAGARQEVGREILAGVRLLEQSYLENLPIERFAAASNMSENLFRKLFVKQLGTSPVKYRNRLRIERAKELLAEGGFTVSEVAYASGFENVGYFCRYYRQVVGESPSETKSATARTARTQKGEKL